MSASEAFLKPDEEAAVVNAIREAEKNTSGEIRVHIESHTDTPHFEKAIAVFESLKMHETQQRNGVLIYIAASDHQFVVLGDAGINQVVPDNFWESTREIIAAEFRKGRFKEGLVKGITQAGEQLKKHFPYNADDKNELPDTLSKS